MNHVHRDVRDAKDRPRPPVTPSGVAGISQAQAARRSMEAHQRSAQALEDMRDMLRTALESLVPIMAQFSATVTPILIQGLEDLKAFGERLAAALEYSPLDTHGD